MSWIDLVKKAKTGDKESLIQLVMNRKEEYYKLAFVYTLRQEDALDAVQDMIVILYDQIRKLKNEECFYSWSKTILVNSCKKVLRSNKKVIPFEAFDDQSVIEKYNDQEMRVDILIQMEKLNKHQREAISLKYFLDMDNQTIAQLTKVPEGTVKSRISLGLKRLKELFGGVY